MMYLPAWYHRHKCGNGGGPNVTWSILQPLSSSQPPVSLVLVEAYAQGEHYPADGPLVRQANVGNTVNTSGGSTVFIQDDNRTPGSLTLEATPAGAGSSAATVSNQGVGFMAGDWHFASHLQCDLGVIANLITAETGNDVGLHAAAGQRVVDTINSVDTFSVDENGMHLLAGVFNLLTGSLSKIAIAGPYTTTATAASFAHNLGDTPDFVITWLAFSSAATCSLTANKATMNSTTVDLRSNIMLSPVYLLSIKF